MNSRSVNEKKKKPKSKIELDDEAQSERFLKAAKELGLGRDGSAFDQVMAVIAKKKFKKK